MYVFVLITHIKAWLQTIYIICLSTLMYVIQNFNLTFLAIFEVDVVIFNGYSRKTIYVKDQCPWEKTPHLVYYGRKKLIIIPNQDIVLPNYPSKTNQTCPNETFLIALLLLINGHIVNNSIDTDSLISAVRIWKQSLSNYTMCNVQCECFRVKY